VSVNVPADRMSGSYSRTERRLTDGPELAPSAAEACCVARGGRDSGFGEFHRRRSCQKVSAGNLNVTGPVPIRFQDSSAHVRRRTNEEIDRAGPVGCANLDRKYTEFKTRKRPAET